MDDVRCFDTFAPSVGTRIGLQARYAPIIECLPANIAIGQSVRSGPISQLSNPVFTIKGSLVVQLERAKDLLHLIDSKECLRSMIIRISIAESAEI